MYNEIEFIFNQMGYEKLSLNVTEPHVNIKLVNTDINTDAEGYVIVTLDETSGIRYTDLQLGHISRQIRNFLMDRNCYLYHFLYIFISSKTPPSSLLDNEVCLWHIKPAQPGLFVYGNILPMYGGLKKAIEEYLGSYSYNTGNSKIYTHNPANNCKQYINSPMAANTCLVIINVIIFILTDFLTKPANGALFIDKGSLSWNLVINNHQYYRIITSMFLHAGADHIFNNAIVLFFIGNYVEQYAGKVKYLIIYFLSGIIAGCTSMIYNMLQYNYTESIGASGAIFGIMGSLLCILLIRHRQADKIDLQRVIFMAFLSLYGGFTSQGVDNAAHIGGFLGGLFITFILFGINSNSGRKAGTNQ